MEGSKIALKFYTLEELRMATETLRKRTKKANW